MLNNKKIALFCPMDRLYLALPVDKESSSKFYYSSTFTSQIVPTSLWGHCSYPMSYLETQDNCKIFAFKPPCLSATFFRFDKWSVPSIHLCHLLCFFLSNLCPAKVCNLRKENFTIRAKHNLCKAELYKKISSLLSLLQHLSNVSIFLRESIESITQTTIPTGKVSTQYRNIKEKHILCFILTQY